MVATPVHPVESEAQLQEAPTADLATKSHRILDDARKCRHKSDNSAHMWRLNRIGFRCVTDPQQHHFQQENSYGLAPEAAQEAK